MMYIDFLLGDGSYFVLFNRMNVSWHCFNWKVLRMTSTSALNNKRKTMEIKEKAEVNESWIFTDTECYVDWKVSLKWNHLFQAFQKRYFQSFLKYDPNTEMNEEIYQNISKSRLYRAISKPLILPCLDVIKWLTRRVDHQRKTLLDFEGKHVASYQPSRLHHMYHFKELYFKVT